MLSDVPHQCPLIQDLMMYVSASQVLMGLQSQDLTFWLLRDVCCVDKGCLTLSVRSDGNNLSIYIKNIPTITRRNELDGVLERVYQTMPFLPLD